MFWFYHEYLDEARRFRIHRVETETEDEARKFHRAACAFDWVTHHVEPSVSPLMRRDATGPRVIAPGHRPGAHYHTDFRWVPMPDYIRTLIVKKKVGNEAAVHGVWTADDGDSVLAPPSPSRTAAEQDGVVTPF